MPSSDERNNGKVLTIAGENDVASGPADFDKAIESAGYGNFNVFILLASLPIAWTTAFDTTTGAFILASAECELELTFIRKGVIVAFPYIGMILATFLWDYITPYATAKTLFLLGLLIDSLLNLLSSAVESYYVFLLVKFISGFIVGGPFAMVMTYLTEFHSVKYKPRFSTWAGLLVSSPVIVPAALGFSILPLNWSVQVFNRKYNSWRIYLVICSIPPIIGLLTASLLPESPKRLFAAGRHEDALGLLRRIYSMNTGKPPDTYPIKALLAGQQKAQLPARPMMNFEKIREGWYNTKVLFSTSYLPAFGFVTFLQFASMLGFNLMRLWVPHLFIILNNFPDDWGLNRAATICEMLNYRTVKPIKPHQNCSNVADTCVQWIVRPVIYQNSTIIASSAVLFSFLAGFVSTSRFQKRTLLLTAFLISVVSSFGINWAQSPPYMLTLAAAIIVTTRIAGNVVTAVNVDVIPIPLRATSLSIITTIGNLGAITGNLVFSALLDTECILSFMGLGCLFSACFCVSCFLPKPVRTKDLSEAPKEQKL